MLKNLADLQLHRLIQQGKHIEACKEIWQSRYGLEYPFLKSASGVKKYGE